MFGGDAVFVPTVSVNGKSASSQLSGGIDEPSAKWWSYFLNTGLL